MALKRCFLAIFVGILTLIVGSCQLSSSSGSASGVVHLTLWQGIGPPPNRDVFQVLVQRFNDRHPDIHVESLYVGHPDQQIPKILTAVVGNAAPDILWYNPTLTGQLVELEAIEPLEDWLTRSPLMSQLDPALLETMEFEEHLWSIPFGSNNTAVFYRPSLFAAAGITEPPRTWEDLLQAAQALTQDIDGDGRVDQQGIFLSLGKGEWNVFVWLPFVYSAGGWLDQNAKPDLVNEGAIAALTFAQTLVQENLAMLSAPERGFEIDNFLTGKVAMQITGPWTLAQMQAAEVDFDVFPLPMDQVPAAVLGGENFFLCHTTPEKHQAALTFLEYILSPEFQQDWALQTGFLPVNLTVRDSNEYQQFVAANPLLQVFLDQMAWARARPLIPGYPYLSENFGRAIEAALLGTDPTEALKQSQQRLELIFGD
ncbi:MAG: ABC transporter substrate-binding protein [Leptolyngbya sp. SIO1D8]|nr:ABC transporter substrate-binding protein [Leptolyngbya sp. SIO1D8]